jgi:hypothetical protein
VGLLAVKALGSGQPGGKAAVALRAQAVGTVPAGVAPGANDDVGTGAGFKLSPDLPAPFLRRVQENLEQC